MTRYASNRQVDPPAPFLHVASQCAVELLAHPGERYLLPGRDILNNDRVILDGSKLVLDIESSQLNPGGFRGERQSSILIRSV